MKKVYFVRFSAYSVAISVVILLFMHYMAYIDIMQQFDKILIALLIVSILGGLFGSFVADYSPE